MKNIVFTKDYSFPSNPNSGLKGTIIVPKGTPGVLTEDGKVEIDLSHFQMVGVGVLLPDPNMISCFQGAPPPTKFEMMRTT